MPIDSQIPLMVQPPQMASPLDSLAKVLQIKGAMAQQQLVPGQQQLQQQAIQEGQLRLQQTKDMNDAYKSAIVTNPDGSVSLDPQRVVSNLAGGSAAVSIPAITEGFTKMQAGVTALQKAKADLAAVHANNAGDIAATVEAVPLEQQPSAMLMAIEHGNRAGSIDPANSKQYTDAITAAQQKDPSGALAQQVTTQAIGMLKQGSEKQRQLATAAQSAQGAADRGAAAKGELDVNKQKQADAETDRAHLAAVGQLAANPPADQGAYAQFLLKQPPAVQQRLMQTVPVEQYDAQKSPGMLNQSAMTPEQRFNAAKPPKPPAPTEAELALTVAKGNAPGASTDDVAAGKAADAALKRLDQSKLAARPNISVNMTPGEASTTAQMIAAGKVDPMTTRAMLRRQPGLIAEVLKADPNFDEADIDKRYNTAKEFTSSSNGKAGGQVIALNTLVHHADLYMQTGEALKNGTFRPGNAAYNAVASAFGSAPPTQANLVARFFAGETAKVATGGVPAEGEVNGILANLGSNASPDQIVGAGKQLLQIAGGRMVPLMEKAKDAHLEKQFPVLGPDATEILTRRGFDPKTMKPVAGGGGGGGQAAQGGYIVGRKYGNLTYQGGDPAQQTNWK